LDEYLVDEPRSGRPPKQTEENKQLIFSKVTLDRYGREKSCADFASDLSSLGIEISASTVRNILKNAGFRKTKPTRKPGLTAKMRQMRLRWCLDHADWTLEDWKDVIWSDETSVLLNHRRGSYRVWRRSHEAFVKSTIRERWTGYQEFMFWGCFSYDKKGPCHSWAPETAQQKKAAEEEIAKLNEELESTAQEEWELNTAMARHGLRNLRGTKPMWKWCKKTGKLERGKKGGIDWYRYQKEILLPKLFPFAKECQVDRPKTVVQEDNAPCHAHYIQQRFFDLEKVQRLLWCPNSPDLNAIEPAWFWMKRWTTQKEPPKSRSEAIQRWQACWDSLPQEAIQAWIERIPHHIKQVIELEGGNEYKEGRVGNPAPVRGRGRPRKSVAVDESSD